MAVKKSGAAKRKALQGKNPKTTGRSTANESEEGLGLGLSLADQSRMNGKYEKYESLEERAKEVERVKRFIFANLMRTAVGMMKNAEKGTNAAGAKLLWDFAEIDKLPAALTAPAQATKAPGAAGDTAVAAVAVEDEDPTKAVLAFYKKLGMTPPTLKPPKPVEVEDEAEASAG